MYKPKKQSLSLYNKRKIKQINKQTNKTQHCTCLPKHSTSLKNHMFFLLWLLNK